MTKLWGNCPFKKLHCAPFYGQSRFKPPRVLALRALIVATICQTLIFGQSTAQDNIKSEIKPGENPEAADATAPKIEKGPVNKTDEKPAFTFYEVRTSGKRVLAVSKVPQPNFENDRIVYLVDRGVSTVMGRARIVKTSISASTSQHFLELNVLEPISAPTGGWTGFLAVSEEAIQKTLTYLKWAPGVNKKSLGAGLFAANSDLRKDTGVTAANSLLNFEIGSDTRPYNHLATLTGISGSIQGQGYHAGLTVFPPKAKNLSWINWFGLGFESSMGLKVSFEGQNAVTKKRETFETQTSENRAIIWIRPNFNSRILSRTGLKIIPWRDAKSSLTSKDSNSKIDSKLNNIQLALNLESNPFSNIYFAFNADVPLKQKQSIKSTNSSGTATDASADLTIYKFKIEGGFRETFGSEKHLFVLEAHAGTAYSWDTFVTPESEENSPKRFYPYGGLIFGYLLK